MAVAFAVKNTESLSFSQVKDLYKIARIKPPRAPIAAASAGVAKPPNIEPRTAAISAVKGTNETKRSKYIFDTGGTSSSRGFEPILLNRDSQNNVNDV